MVFCLRFCWLLVKWRCQTMVLMAKPLKTEPFALAFWKLFLQKNVPDPNRIYNLYQSQTGSIYRSVRAVLVRRPASREIIATSAIRRWSQDTPPQHHSSRSWPPPSWQIRATRCRAQSSPPRDGSRSHGCKPKDRRIQGP